MAGLGNQPLLPLAGVVWSLASCSTEAKEEPSSCLVRRFLTEKSSVKGWRLQTQGWRGKDLSPQFIYRPRDGDYRPRDRGSRLFSPPPPRLFKGKTGHFWKLWDWGGEHSYETFSLVEGVR